MSDEDRLQDLLDGRLGPDEAEEMRRRMARDEALRRRFLDLLHVRRSLQELGRRSRAPEGFEEQVLERLGLGRPVAARTAWAQLAAAALLVVVAAALWRLGASGRVAPPASAPAEAPSKELARRFEDVPRGPGGAGIPGGAPGRGPSEKTLRRLDVAGREKEGRALAPLRVLSVVWGGAAGDEKKTERAAVRPLPRAVVEFAERHGAKILAHTVEGPGRFRVVFSLPARRVSSFADELGRLGGRPAPPPRLAPGGVVEARVVLEVEGP